MGKIRQVTDPTGTYGFAYDNMGRLTGTTTQYSFLPGHNLQNGYTYDAASNRKSLTAPDGSTNTYNYDTAGGPGLAILKPGKNVGAPEPALSLSKGLAVFETWARRPHAQ